LYERKDALEDCWRGFEAEEEACAREREQELKLG